MRLFILATLTVICFTRCKQKTANVHFYHWKVNATLSEIEKKALATTSSKSFIHYFDVVLSDNIAHPVAVIEDVDTLFNHKEVIPVIFIRNSVFKNSSISVEKLADQIQQLTQQIHVEYFGENSKEIQIDCDWTTTTASKYFKFLKELKSKFTTTSATIRLHQIKYAKETGIPPVDYGALMLYNVGDLKNFNKNSILDYNIVNQYINKKSTYPLNLDVALPLFSQLVVKNNLNKIRLINNGIINDFKNDSIHFQKTTDNVYKVKEKILYRGQYLYKGFKIKLEKTTTNEIVKCFELVKNSNLNTKNIILYHLDETEIKELNFNDLIAKLK